MSGRSSSAFSSGLGTQSIAADSGGNEDGQAEVTVDRTALHFTSATALAAAIRAGEVSSLEAVEACLRRIEAVNLRLNAVVRLTDDAVDAARAADAAVRAAGRAGTDRGAGITLGPLHGVPFTIKDSIDTAGVVTTAGTVGWTARVPQRDATVMARLRAAGAILLGKTNTPEFTWKDETDNDVFGRTSNAYAPERTSGGSSGGSAAIVAAGGSPFDVGSDSGNSIRTPAHFNGVAGLKPTQGRVPRTGHSPAFHGILGGWTQLGPIARAVDDLALVLRVISGPDGEDPHVMPVLLGDPTELQVETLRVVFFTDNGLATPTPETVAAVTAAARVLADAGAQVEERLPAGLNEASELWSRLVGADGYAWLRRLIRGAGTPGDGTYPGLAARGMVPADELTDLLERQDAVRSRLLHFMADVDVIVSPVVPAPAFRHGEAGAFVDTYAEPHNLSGFPAGVVRAGTSPEGLPIGVQVVGAPWREDVVLATMGTIETALGGWRPPPQ